MYHRSSHERDLAGQMQCYSSMMNMQSMHVWIVQHHMLQVPYYLLKKALSGNKGKDTQNPDDCLQFLRRWAQGTPTMVVLV
jgi:hypothetical protein